MADSMTDEFERGRRAGVVETLNVLESRWGAIGRDQLAQLHEQARLAEPGDGEFDLREFLEAMVLEQKETDLADSDASVFGDDDR
jgi:hypothetical protein